METYTFHEGPLPSGFAPDFEPAIFNLPDFFTMKGPAAWLSYHVLNHKTQTAVSSVHFHVEDGIAKSPLKAPFGSVDCSEKIDPALLYQFMTHVELQLKGKGVKDVHIKNPPHSYASGMLSLLECFLLNLGYVVMDAECGATIAIDNNQFSVRIAHSEMLRHRQAIQAGLYCRMLPETSITEVYAFIASCYRAKGYKISVSADDLAAMVKKFPARYVMFGAFDGSKLIGASVSIRVKQHILYNFLINHDVQYNHLSPPLLLVEGLYSYCSDNGISILDLGTSAIDRQPNFSLLGFKLRIGGVPTTKLSFHKKIG